MISVTSVANLKRADAVARKRSLDENISSAVRYERRISKALGVCSLLLMALALSCSGGAVVAGFFFSSGKIAGGLALLPPLIAFIVLNLRLDARKDWHSRKHHELEALRYRLHYQIPNNPTADQIAAIAESFTALNLKFMDQFKTTCEFNWNNLTGRGPS